MAEKFYEPPSWQDNQTYEEYKKAIEVWRLLKVAKPEEEGPLLYRNLKGKAQDEANKLTLAEIGSATGLQKILDKLDVLFVLFGV